MKRCDICKKPSELRFGTLEGWIVKDDICICLDCRLLKLEEKQ